MAGPWIQIVCKFGEKFAVDTCSYIYILELYWGCYYAPDFHKKSLMFKQEEKET